MGPRGGHSMRVRAVEPESFVQGETPRRHNGEWSLPWTQHELATELRGIASSLPDGHAHSQRVAHDHGDAAYEAMPDVLALLCVGTRVVRPERHTQRRVQTQRWVRVQGNWHTEDICIGFVVSAEMWGIAVTTHSCMT